MTISYNRLWKLLIDRGITKTEMRKRVSFESMDKKFQFPGAFEQGFLKLEE